MLQNGVFESFPRFAAIAVTYSLSMKQIYFFRKMHSNQEMLDYRNGYSRNNIFWCGNSVLEGH